MGTASGDHDSKVFVTNAVKHFKWEPRDLGEQEREMDSLIADLRVAEASLRRELERTGGPRSRSPAE